MAGGTRDHHRSVTSSCWIPSDKPTQLIHNSQEEQQLVYWYGIIYKKSTIFVYGLSNSSTCDSCLWLPCGFPENRPSVFMVLFCFCWMLHSDHQCRSKSCNMNRSDTILDVQQTEMIERGISARIVLFFLFYFF